MQKLIFTLILILAGYIAYMYFFGKGEDKANAQTIVQESKEVAHSIGDFLKRQKEKYDDGEFDRLLRRVDNSIEKLKSTASEAGEESEKSLRELRDELRKVDELKLSEENRLRLRKSIQDIDDALQNKH